MLGLGAAVLTGEERQSPASRYERLESRIGEGTYGKVHKARDLRTGQCVAVKKCKCSAADRELGGLGFTALREVKLMQAVRHPNVMGCLDVFSDGGALHIVMEFMDGDLRKLVEDRSVSLSEAHIKSLAKQLCQGLAAIHQRFFVHRDLSAMNILLSFSTGVAKIADFGFTRTIGHKERPLTPHCTTLWYRAPELLYGARFYGQAVDIWSAGCIIGELFLRKAFFLGETQLDMLTKIFEKRGTPTESTWKDVSALPTFLQYSHHPPAPMATILPSASAAAHDLLGSLLTLDPKQRPSADGVLESEFFTTANPEACEPRELPFVRQISLSATGA